jgi:transcription-repair coupling factor (superfamily II helicase)
VTLQTLVPLIQESPLYQEALQRALALVGDHSPDGQRTGDYRPPAFALELPVSARPYVLAALQRDWPGPLLVLSGRPEQARHLIEQLRLFADDHEAIRYFQPPDTLFYDRPPWDRQTLHARVSLLTALAKLPESPEAGWGTLVATSVWALMTKTAPPMAIRRAMRTLRVGMTIPMYDLLTQAVQAGYEAAVVVEEPGTFTHRGSIIDLYPPNLPHPLRIDFFGDEIDSIRTFDPGTQRSLGTLQETVWGPAVEALPEWGPAAHQRLQALDLAGCNSRTRQQMAEQIEAIGQGNYFDGFEYYMPYLYPRAATLLDYMPANALVLLDDLTALESAAAALENQATSLRANMERDGDLPPNWAVPYLNWPEMIERLRRVHTVGLGYAHAEQERALGEAFAAPPVYGGQIQEALDDIAERRDEGQRLVIVTRQAERMADLLRERHLYVTPGEVLAEPPPPGGVALVNGILSEGFRLAPADLTVLTDAEILGWVQQQRRRPAARRQAPPEVLISDLKEGDYVVHIEYGIGRYHWHGAQERSATSNASTWRSSTPRATGCTCRSSRPTWSAATWAPTTASRACTGWVGRMGRRCAPAPSARCATWPGAAGAVCHARDGHRARLSPDTTWQHELENSFPYEETDDQLRALEEVKADMEQPRPMDRLLCGDVGYGKTEVALRAAFKAVMDGKQVAVLVPTTVLAQQHYHTFRRRLRAFPVVVEMLSRFRTPQEQEEVMQRPARRHGRHRHRHPSAALKPMSRSRTWGCWSSMRSSVSA